ncbi:SLC13 family permease [Pelagibius litoralis]|uniref:SLC13 family permease n=1 Tax=Pelagibius litoralis TaxID=374515 RepID=A0A967EVG4_9PROT|nr:SLC13 family permease [Pelagibius litoralis]NIA67819.1 SLC13 family permease [Pelagibius litoralis]
MTEQQMLIFAILAGLFGLLVWGRWRYDVVAFACLMVTVVTGLVPINQAFSGFGHPATITVAAVLILSRVLSGSGAIDLLARLIRPAMGSTTGHAGILAGLGAAMSTMMNNVGALGILLPMALQSARKAARAPAKLLMPLSFGSILGGLITLIGTPPNIIIATYREEVTGEPFAMFDYAPVGLAVAAAGLIFVALIGWRLVPDRGASQAAGGDLFDIENYITEVAVPADNPHIGKTLSEIDELTKDIDAVIMDQIRNDRVYPAATRKQLQAGDILKIEAAPEEIDKFVTKLGLEIGSEDSAGKKAKKTEDATLMEAVVAPGSRLEGRLVGSLRLFARRGIMILAVSRQGKPFRGRLRSFRIRPGDVLLLHGETEQLADLVPSLGCLPLAERELHFGKRKQGPAVIAIFAAAIAAASLGLVPIQIAFGIAVAVLVVGGFLQVRELYDGIDWPVIVLLASLIPVGGALQTTGATTLIADGLLLATAGLSAVVVLVVVMVVTMTLSDILNNAATAVVMAPIAATIAERLGVNADPFLMATAVAASCAFLTPIGHQNNALILGPGGYRFGDYWRMGLPLEILVIMVAVPMILLVWPL